MADRSLIVLTPVKDEAWILERFIAAAAVWADHIIVADQGSEDASREIARAHPKVRLVENDSPAYDEGARQRLLLDAARSLPGERVLFAFDADEMLSADALSDGFLERVRSAPAGTAVWMRWANLLPGAQRAWVVRDDYKVFGFVDDGRPHTGNAIHSARLPAASGDPRIVASDVYVLHLQYLWWSRMKAKQRWYQCWEALNHPDKRPIQIFRQYHHMDAIHPQDVVPVHARWLAGYRDRGLEPLPAELDDGPTRWDAEVLDWLVEHGPERFARIDLWDVDWAAIATALGRQVPAERIADPRGRTSRAIMRWLARTQSRAERSDVRTLQRALIPFGW